MHHRSHDQGRGVCIQGSLHPGREGVCLQGESGLHPGRGALHPGGSALRGYLPTGGLHPGAGGLYSQGLPTGREDLHPGVCLQGRESASREGWQIPPGTRKSGGAHPTGMLPCYKCCLQVFTTCTLSQPATHTSGGHCINFPVSFQVMKFYTSRNADRQLIGLFKTNTFIT